MKTVIFTRSSGVYQIGDAASFDDARADAYVKIGSAIEHDPHQARSGRPATLEDLKRTTQITTGQIKA